MLAPGLVRISNSGVHRSASSRPSSRSSRLAASSGGSPCDVEQSRRDLDHHRLRRVPVLPQHQHPAVVIERDDADRARVRDDLPVERLAVVLDGVAADAEQHPVEDRLDAADRPGLPARR